MAFSHAIFIVFLLYPLTFVESLRCAHDCSFVFLSLNATLPFNVCKHEERDDAQCTVTVEIDFKNKSVFGLLNMNTRDSIATLRIKTRFQREINSVITNVSYTCTMSDYCDHEFLNELMTNKLAEFNATSVQEKLFNLLYTSTPNTTDIQCVNGTCPSDSFCQAELGNIIISNYNYTSIDGNLPCVNLNSIDYFLKLDQNLFPFGSQANGISVRCNTDECNSTITEVYALLRNDFILPLNYSILDINTTHPSAASLLISFNSLIMFCVFVLFYDSLR